MMLDSGACVCRCFSQEQTSCFPSPCSWPLKSSPESWLQTDPRSAIFSGSLIGSQPVYLDLVSWTPDSAKPCLDFVHIPDPLSLWHSSRCGWHLSWMFPLWLTLLPSLSISHELAGQHVKTVHSKCHFPPQLAPVLQQVLDRAGLTRCPDPGHLPNCEQEGIYQESYLSPLAMQFI